MGYGTWGKYVTGVECRSAGWSYF